MKEMKTVCFQAKLINGLVHKIDVKFQVAPTTCTSQLSLGVIIFFIILCLIKYFYAWYYNSYVIPRWCYLVLT